MSVRIDRYYGTTQAGNPSGPSLFQGGVVTINIGTAADYLATVGFPILPADAGLATIDHVLPHMVAHSSGLVLVPCWSPTTGAVLLYKQDGSTGALVECADADAAIHEGDKIVCQVLGTAAVVGG